MEMNNTRALVTQNNAVQTIPLDRMDAVAKLGESMAKSGMFGEISASAGAMVALTMYQEGLSPLDFTRRYHVIDGKITKRADSTLAEFRQRGGKYKIKRADAECCEIDFDYDGNKMTGKMTIEEAKASGIAMGKSGVKTNWLKFPQQMLFARVVTNTVRMVMPEIVSGIYSPEEVAEFNDNAPRAVEPMNVPSPEPEVIPPSAPTKPKKAAKKPVEAKAEPPVEVATEAVVVAPAPSQTTPASPYDRCPIKGKLFGVAWSDMTPDIVAVALRTEDPFPEMTPEYRAAAQAVYDTMMAADTEDLPF